MFMTWRGQRLWWAVALLFGVFGCAGAPYSDSVDTTTDAAWKHASGDASGPPTTEDVAEGGASDSDVGGMGIDGSGPTDSGGGDASAGDGGGSGGQDAAPEAGAPPAIARVQTLTATPQAAADVISLTFSKAQQAGDLVVVAVGWNDATSAVTSISDTKGNVYQLAVGPTRKPPNLTQSIYYAADVAAAGAGANTLTVTLDAKASTVDVRVAEYSGLSAGPLDATAAASGNGTSASSGSATTASGRELIFGAGMCTDLYGNAGSGFNFVAVTSDGDMIEDRFVSSAGSYSAAASINLSADWVMQMATFR
jgi:hypothetical protein